MILNVQDVSKKIQYCLNIRASRKPTLFIKLISMVGYFFMSKNKIKYELELQESHSFLNWSGWLFFCFYKEDRNAKTNYNDTLL